MDWETAAGVCRRTISAGGTGSNWFGGSSVTFQSGETCCGRTFMRCYQTNPSAVRQTVSLLALYLHLGPYARQAIAETERAIAEIELAAHKDRLRLPLTLTAESSVWST